jgi:hypothetical protein
MSRARLVGFGLIVVAVMSVARVAGAQTFGPERAEPLTLDFAPALLNASAVPMARLTSLEQMPMAPIVPQRPKLGGKSLLNSLYASTVAMQVLDVHSTLRAFNAGAVEGNPAMAGITGNRAAFVATKAAVAAASIWAAHKLSKRNKVAAVVTLVAVNSAYAMIVSHNYRLAGRLGS